MAVIIVTQRDVNPDNQEEVFDLLRQLRAKAVLQPGYLLGETLFSAGKSGNFLTISRWRSLKDWHAWENSPERRQILSKIDPLLVASAVVSVYLDSPAPVPEGV